MSTFDLANKLEAIHVLLSYMFNDLGEFLEEEGVAADSADKRAMAYALLDQATELTGRALENLQTVAKAEDELPPWTTGVSPGEDELPDELRADPMLGTDPELSPDAARADDAIGMGLLGRRLPSPPPAVEVGQTGMLGDLLEQEWVPAPTAEPPATLRPPRRPEPSIV